MKRLICVILAICLGMLLVGCEADDTPTKKHSSKQPEKLITPDFLTKGVWEYHDDNIGENIGITFCENGEFYYNCDCGEPVGDSDIYDKFSYNEKTNTIGLYGSCGEKKLLDIVYCDDYYLALKIDDKVVSFENSAKELDHWITESAKEHIGNNLVCVAVLDYDSQNHILTVAPYDYDGDAKKDFEDKIIKLKTNNDFEAKSISVTIEGEVETEFQHIELKQSDFENIGEYYTSGFLDFDDEKCVEAVIFYGCIKIY